VVSAVELSITRNGQQLDIVRRSLCGKSGQHTIVLAEVTGVVIEVYDGAARIVIELGSGRIPLTDTWSTDDLSDKAAEVGRFLGRPPDGPVRGGP
jgi:hypothetical protein